MHALCNAIAYTLARHNEAEVGDGNPDGKWLSALPSGANGSFVSLRCEIKL